jgi:hypothetical protein
MNALISNGIFDKSKIFLNFWRGDKCKYGNFFLVKIEIECNFNKENPEIESSEYIETKEKCEINIKIKSKYGTI